MNGNNHQVHLHGQHFQVLKIGYPNYTEFEHVYDKPNQDFSCMDEFCNRVSWSNESWRADNAGEVPGIVKQAPILKDTIIVPIGGYTVVRFKADNPGNTYYNYYNVVHTISLLPSLLPSFLLIMFYILLYDTLFLESDWYPPILISVCKISFLICPFIDCNLNSLSLNCR